MTVPEEITVTEGEPPVYILVTSPLQPGDYCRRDGRVGVCRVTVVVVFEREDRELRCYVDGLKTRYAQVGKVVG